ncbi:MAG: hypothetical protein V1886_02115 [archaeon]
MTRIKEHNDKKVDRDMASEIFEQAHFMYSTRSIEETVRVMKIIGLERTAKAALYGSCIYSNLFN